MAIYLRELEECPPSVNVSCCEYDCETDSYICESEMDYCEECW